MRALALAPLALVLGCVAPDAEPRDEVREATAAVIGGEATSGDPAVVLLATWAPDLSVLDLCTASLIAPDVLLTAAHCVDDDAHPGWGLGVFPGPDASAYPTASTLVPQLLPVAEVHVHPDYDPDPPFTADIALVVLEAPLPVDPLPIAWDALSEDLVGGPARIVGYGQTVYEQPNFAKHAADTVFAAFDEEPDTITVGDLDHKTCVGDSGGPALVVIDGAETVVGVNSYTDLMGCLEPAHYRRTDVYASWIANYVEPPPASGGAGGAGGGSAAGAGGEGAGDTSSGGAGGAGGASDDEGCTYAPRGVTTPWQAAVVGLAAVAFVARRRTSRA